MTPADVLRGALEVLQGGWIKGKAHSPEGHCLLGATADFLSPNYFHPLRFFTIMALEDVVLEQFPERVRRVDPGLDTPSVAAQFNDHPDTTFEDVEMVVEKAIVKLEERA